MAIKGLLHHLPDVVHPLETVCYQIPVPKDPWYIRAFVGTFYELASARSWDNDEAHTALEAAKVWLEIALNLKPGCENTRDIGGSEDGEQMLRVNPDNPCELQEFCGGTWVHFWGEADCAALGGGGQPGPGGGGPGPGENTDNCYSLEANSQLLLPVPVEGGFVLTTHSMSGGWNDGGGAWYCPNGQSFSLGFCTGVGGYNGADPLPTALHGSLIAKINGIYYPTDGPINVPNGTPSSDVEFQMNDASLSDNSGSIKFCVQVANKAEAGFDHTFNFATNNGGWVAAPRSEGPGCAAAGANYTPGTGWTEYPCPSINARYINVSQAFSPRELTFVEITFTGDNLGTYSLDAEIYINQGGVETLIASASSIGTSPYVLNATGSWPGVQGLRLRIAAGGSSDHITMTAGRITGAGSDPF